jgi:hypothetical protein
VRREAARRRRRGHRAAPWIPFSGVVRIVAVAVQPPPPPRGSPGHLRRRCRLRTGWLQLACPLYCVSISVPGHVEFICSVTLGGGPSVNFPSTPPRQGNGSSHTFRLRLHWPQAHPHLVAYLFSPPAHGTSRSPPGCRRSCCWVGVGREGRRASPAARTIGQRRRGPEQYKDR